ncbi:hypothetical protein ZL58_14035 [Salmonella enterica subsp. enterica serovar Typhimurium]|nr:hypothetical protein [Salmonella enterica subsp. enterica serovar Typhimurium]
MTTDEPVYVWVVDKKPVSEKYDPMKIESYISKRELIKETPKGLRLSMSGGTWDSFFANTYYEFFYSEIDALAFIKAEAEAAIDAVINRHLALQHLVHDLDAKMGIIK